jgi:hypothetical protein
VDFRDAIKYLILKIASERVLSNEEKIENKLKESDQDKLNIFMSLMVIDDELKELADTITPHLEKNNPFFKNDERGINIKEIANKKKE